MTSFVDDNGNYLDYSGEDFALTKQAAIFNNFKIKGDISLTFRLENNSKNRETLNYYGISQIDSAAMIRKRFTLIRNGNRIARGFIIISDEDGNYLKVFFLSGNSNWVRKFDFKCNEIRNPDFTVTWDTTRLHDLRTATQGIIFPFIDFFSGRKKLDKYFLSTLWGGTRRDAATLYTEFYPCLYVHTLINELSKTANVKINGTLLQDRLYKSLIITPSGPDMVDPATGLRIDFTSVVNSGGGNAVPIGSIAPTFKAIDLIKWVVVSLGCVAYFDDYSNTLTINLIDKFKKEDAEDWSEYFISHTIEYDKVYQHNYIKCAESNEDEIKDYNAANDVNYGEIDIQSNKDDGSDNTIYSSPILIPKDDLGDAPMQWATPFVEFVKLEDQEGRPYTSVSDLAGKARFNGTGFGLDTEDAPVVRVADDTGLYTGIHMPNVLGAPTDVRFDSYSDFIGTSTGDLFIQNVSKVNAGHRILVCVPNLSVKQFTMFTSLNLRTFGDITTAAYAYAFKPRYPYSTLLANKQGVSYGEVNLTGYNDVSLSEGYMNKFKKMITNPPVLAEMRLPEAVFSRWKFDKFIFLKTEKLTGYFIVQKITEYVDGATPVEVELLYAD